MYKNLTINNEISFSNSEKSYRELQEIQENVQKALIDRININGTILDIHSDIYLFGGGNFEICIKYKINECEKTYIKKGNILNLRLLGKNMGESLKKYFDEEIFNTIYEDISTMITKDLLKSQGMNDLFKVLSQY